MKRVRNSDINFKLDQKAIKVSDFSIIFYTVDSVNFFIELNQDDVVEVEREATVEDEDVIRSGGTKATDYYLKLDWHNLKNIGDGVLKYRCINNIVDDGFYDKQYNRLFERTTEYYIDTVEVDPEDKRNYADLIADVDTKVDEEIDRAISAETDLSIEIETKLSIEDFNVYSAETDTKIDNAGGFIKVINPSASTKVGLVNKLSQYYDTNIGEGAVIEGEGYSESNLINASGAHSHAEGYFTQANGNYSHAEGYSTKASGVYSHAEGQGTTASNMYSHAEGNGTIASNYASHAEGNSTIAKGNSSHAEGSYTFAIGNYSHAEGGNTQANGYISHAEGYYTQAIGDYSHAEGQSTIANNQSEHASGQYNVSSKASTTFGHSGNTLFSVGNGTSNSNKKNAFEIRQNGDIYINDKSGNTVNLQNEIDSKQDAGDYVSATTFNAFSSKTDNDINTKLNISDFNTYSANTEIKIDNAGGFIKVINPSASTKVGLVNKLSKYYSTNIGDGAVIEGDGNIYNAIIASGELSHAEGHMTQAIGDESHAEGTFTQAIGALSHVEGYETIASGYTAHAEGSYTQASGNYSHAEGQDTTASGQSSHAEGYGTKANAYYSHAEGQDTIAIGERSHAEGNGTLTSGSSSHAEGTYTKAIGLKSHAEGYYTQANGECSHAEGNETIANNNSEHASGQYNVSSRVSTTFGDSGNTLFSVGNGTSKSARHNAFEIRQNGDIYLSLNGSDIKLQDLLAKIQTLENELADLKNGISAGDY